MIKVCGLAYTDSSTADRYEKRAIQHHAAHYDSVTGKLTWNDETTAEKKP